MTYVTFPQTKPLDFVAIGRLCIDLNANEINRPMEETMTFTKYVGGSPANITIGMARLGMKTAFIGKIANDQMGRFIAGYLQRNSIETSECRDRSYRRGNRASLYRNQKPDGMQHPDVS